MKLNAKRFEDSGDLTKAISSYEKCLKLNVNNFEVSLRLANLLTELGQGRKASPFYQNALRLKPGSVAATYGLVLAIERHASDPKDAIDYLELSAKTDPDNFVLLT